MSLDRNWMWMKPCKVDVVSFNPETSEPRKKDFLGEMATGRSLEECTEVDSRKM